MRASNSEPLTTRQTMALNSTTECGYNSASSILKEPVVLERTTGWVEMASVLTTWSAKML